MGLRPPLGRSLVGVVRTGCFVGRSLLVLWVVGGDVGPRTGVRRCWMKVGLTEVVLVEVGWTEVGWTEVVLAEIGWTEVGQVWIGLTEVGCVVPGRGRLQP